jgi:hypothetical protein
VVYSEDFLERLEGYRLVHSPRMTRIGTPKFDARYTALVSVGSQALPAAHFSGDIGVVVSGAITNAVWKLKDYSVSCWKSSWRKHLEAKSDASIVAKKEAVGLQKNAGCKIGKEKNVNKEAYEIGVKLALQDAGLVKTAIPWWNLAAMGGLGAGTGALAAGEGNRLKGALTGGALGAALGTLGGMGGAKGGARVALRGGRPITEEVGEKAVRNAIVGGLGGMGIGTLGGGYLGGRAMRSDEK